jgi:hypothetical protein
MLPLQTGVTTSTGARRAVSRACRLCDRMFNSVGVYLKCTFLPTETDMTVAMETPYVTETLQACQFISRSSGAHSESPGFEFLRQILLA